MISSTQDQIQRTVDLVGTPCYVYDESLIKRNIERFTSIPYEPKAIRFATMANNNPALLRLLKASGSRAPLTRSSPTCPMRSRAARPRGSSQPSFTGRSGGGSVGAASLSLRPARRPTWTAISLRACSAPRDRRSATPRLTPSASPPTECPGGS